MAKLTKGILDKILDEFAKKGKIFSNEAQFRFELARALYKKGYKITFEHLTYYEDNKGNKEKMYTDLIVEDKEEKLYAIELKYKTSYKEHTYKIGDKKFYTFVQGAEDSGCYDYLKDVERLERLILGDFKDKFKEQNNQKEIKRGFAIILTNSIKYYKHSRSNHNYYWESFFLERAENKSLIEKTGKLYWMDPGTKDNEPAKLVRGKIDNENDGNIIWEYVGGDKCEKNNPGFKWTKERYKEITLQHSYTIKWKPYDVEFEKDNNNPPEFKYLILEVEKENNDEPKNDV